MFHSHGGSATNGKSHRPLETGRRKRLPQDSRHRAQNADIKGHLMVRDFLEYLGSPRALSVWMLYHYGEHRQLVEMTIDPHHYNCGDSFKRDFAATKLLSKCTGLSTGIPLAEVAIESAQKAELQCQATNEFIRALRTGGVRHISGLDAQVFHRARAKIATILGDVPSSFEEVGWSKGRTTSSWGEKLSSVYKYGARPESTASALRYAVRAIGDSPVWGAAVLNAGGPVTLLKTGVTIVRGNVMLTVPKTAKTDRVICYEPHMNIRLQLSVGQHLRSRLKKFGINLDDQSVNQRRAALGAKFGHLCTIDLSAASDTVAFELVCELLPIDWVCLLDDLRSKYTIWPDGQCKKNEKFSSMGNGFTFELESLLFYAVCSAVSEDVSVYGDDIVLPSQNYDLAVAALGLCGFTVNTAKSYSTSYFRESCGQNSFGGLSVTPVYLRSSISDLEDVVHFHNQVRRWALQNHFGDSKVARLLRLWRDIHPHPCGPMGYGDGHYHTNFDEATPKRASYQLDGWWFTTYVRLINESTWGDDKVQVFPAGLGYAAICAATGPKRPRSIWDTGASRRRVRFKKHRGLCHGSWPDGLWY